MGNNRVYLYSYPDYENKRSMLKSKAAKPEQIIPDLSDTSRIKWKILQKQNKTYAYNRLEYTNVIILVKQPDKHLCTTQCRHVHQKQQPD